MTTDKNKEQIYEDTIAPLVDQIRAICEQHRIAFCVTFATPTEEHPSLLIASSMVFEYDDTNAAIAGCAAITMDEADGLPREVAELRGIYLSGIYALLCAQERAEKAEAEKARAGQACAH